MILYVCQQTQHQLVNTHTHPYRHVPLTVIRLNVQLMVVYKLTEQEVLQRTTQIYLIVKVLVLHGIVQLQLVQYKQVLGEHLQVRKCVLRHVHLTIVKTLQHTHQVNHGHQLMVV